MFIYLFDLELRNKSEKIIDPICHFWGKSRAINSIKKKWISSKRRVIFAATFFFHAATKSIRIFMGINPVITPRKFQNVTPFYKQEEVIKFLIHPGLRHTVVNIGCYCPPLRGMHDHSQMKFTNINSA